LQAAYVSSSRWQPAKSIGVSLYGFMKSRTPDFHRAAGISGVGASTVRMIISALTPEKYSVQ
jgi:hypothetical protein